MQAGLEKSRVKKKQKKKQPTGFFYIFVKKREFLGFFSFKNTFRCTQTLNYNYSYYN